MKQNRFRYHDSDTHNYFIDKYLKLKKKLLR